MFYPVFEGHPYCGVSGEGFSQLAIQSTVELSYSEIFAKQIGKTEVDFLQKTDPSRIYFNYAETI